MIADIVLVESPDEMARQFVRRFLHAARAAVAARRRFACALTGGSSARLYRALHDAELDWERIELYWGDERAVPPDHADSNFRLARENLIDEVPIPEENIHRMPAEEDDLEAASRLYEEELPASFDLVHLGMGADGHVCSLFPGHPVLEERLAHVRPIYDAPKPPPRRLTLTLNALQVARVVLFTVSGPDKADAVRTAIEDTHSQLPAARVAHGPVPVAFLLDRTAGSQLRGH
ncbi:MAG TPA: 6-phosphogluconolactonase [Polyangia bacterium]|nr:6-phosphogluconolactonase [Polyangia bacterium]